MSKSPSKQNKPLKAVPPKPRPATVSRVARGLESTRLFLFLIVLFVAGLVLWASAAPVDRVVRVEGAVIPAGRNQQIQHLEGGIIASIDTTEGATVKRGDLLLTIDGTTANADMGEIRDKLDAARASVIRLQAETQDKDKLVFPPDLASLPVATAEKNLFEARRQNLDDEISVHQDTIKQRAADIAEAGHQRAQLENELETAQQRLTMEQNMAAQGAASQIEVLDAQSRVQNLKTQIGMTADSIPKFRAAISEEQARIGTVKAEFISQAHNDLVSSLEDVNHYSQASTTSADRLKRTEVRAPTDGIINHIVVNTVGRVVKPGETLIELTPFTNEILIEAKAAPRDRGYLRIGLDAQVRISAYDSSELGLLKGSVTEVGADSILDAHGDPYYQINILVKSLPPKYAGHIIVPGMTVTADIVTGRRTILAYLLSPINKFTYDMFRDPR